MKSDCGVSRCHKWKQGDDSPKWAACSNRHPDAHLHWNSRLVCLSVLVFVLDHVCVSACVSIHTVYMCGIHMFRWIGICVHTCGNKCVYVVYNSGGANRWEVVGTVVHLSCTHARTQTSQGVSLQIGFSPLGWQSWQALYERHKQGCFTPSQLSHHAFNLKLQISF